MSRVPQWSDALGGRADWDKIFDGFESTVDYPGAYFYQSLMATFPDAKVLLSVRDGESWARSMRDTIWGSLWGDTLMHDLTKAQARIDPDRARYAELMRALYTSSGLFGDEPGRFDMAAASAAMERYNEEVRRVVPADRLLVWSAGDGWAPLCEFLGRPVPEVPLPRSNDARAFCSRVIDGCLAALNKWRVEAGGFAPGLAPATVLAPVPGVAPARSARSGGQQFGEGELADLGAGGHAAAGDDISHG
jgi:hypothetical protein